MAEKILRLPSVIDRIALARSTIYLRIAQGTFPAPIQLGGRAVGWVESEISAWLEDQIANSRNSTSEGA